MSEGAQRERALSLAELADELERWTRIKEIDRDEYGAFDDLKHIHKFAIANYDQPGIELLLEALDPDSRSSSD